MVGAEEGKLAEAGRRGFWACVCVCVGEREYVMHHKAIFLLDFSVKIQKMTVKCQGSG